MISKNKAINKCTIFTESYTILYKIAFSIVFLISINYIIYIKDR